MDETYTVNHTIWRREMAGDIYGIFHSEEDVMRLRINIRASDKYKIATE